MSLYAKQNTNSDEYLAKIREIVADSMGVHIVNL